MSGRLPKRAILVVNAKSRQGAEAYAPAVEKLAAAGVELIEAHAVKDPRRMGTTIRRAVKAAPMVIIGGGDGSLSKAVDDFMGTKTVFAVLPLGTANSFARTLGLPLDLDGAIEVIANGEARPIDIGCIEGDYFLNNAALGIAPLVAETVPDPLKKRLGRFGYLIWAGVSATSFKAFRLTVEDGKRAHRLWATEVRIANGRFHGGIELIEEADVTSGEILVQAVRGRSLLRLGWNYAGSLLKRRSAHEAVREFRGRELRISTRPRMRVSIDGELGPETPFTASVVPGAVIVAAPKGS